MHHNRVARLTTSLPPRIIDIDFCFMPFKIIYLYSVSSLSYTTTPAGWRSRGKVKCVRMAKIFSGRNKNVSTIEIILTDRISEDNEIWKELIIVFYILSFPTFVIGRVIFYPLMFSDIFRLSKIESLFLIHLILLIFSVSISINSISL